MVPDTLTALKPLSEPFNTALPTTLNELPAPANVELNVTVVPVNVVFAPSVIPAHRGMVVEVLERIYSEKTA